MTDDKAFVFDYSIAEGSWELIKRLSIHPRMVKSISHFTNLDETDDSEFKFENIVDVHNPFHIIYFLELVDYIISNTEANQTMEVIFNEDEPISAIAQSAGAPVYGPHLEVKGQSVGTGTSTQTTNSNVPPPVPAIPINKSNLQKFSAQGKLRLSKSGQGKATNIVPASTGTTNIPPPPPIPGSADPSINFVKSDDDKEGKDDFYDQDENDGQGEVGTYPPKKTDSSPAKTATVADDQIFINYAEQFRASTGYLEEELPKSSIDWVKGFIDRGGLDFFLNVFLSEDTFIHKCTKPNEVITFEEKRGFNKILSITGGMILGACLIKTISEDDDSNTSHVNTTNYSTEKENEANSEDPYSVDEESVLDSSKASDVPLASTQSLLDRTDDEKLKREFFMNALNDLKKTALPLVEAMDKEYCEKVLNSVSLDRLMEKYLSIIAHFLSKRDLNEVDLKTADHILTFVVIICRCQESTLETMYNYYDEQTKLTMKDIIIKGLTFIHDANLKRKFFTLVQGMSSSIVKTEKVRLPLMYMLELCKEHFYQTFKEDFRGYGYTEFFSIFANLIHQYFQMQEKGNKKFEKLIEPKQFISEIVELLKKYKTKEKRNTMIEDTCLIGVLTILQRLLEDKTEYIEEFAIDHGLLHEIFFDCLFQDTLEAPKIDVTVSFDTNSTDLHTNKAKTKESRSKAFSILNLLCHHSSKVRDYVYENCLIKMISQIQKPENFAYVPESESRSLYSQSGLKNQGATCYMNSMIQQLFMIPTFKYLLLSINDQKDEEIKTVEDDKSVYYNKHIDDNLLHQFQNTMGFLELTERPYYDPIGLCFSMKDYEGNPTNCSLQQDSLEFVNLSFDRLESMMKPTPQQYLIKDIFSAKQCTHMTCSNCDHNKRIIEDYYMLSLPVKNFANLDASLKAYIDGEVISDYRCDNCDQKVDINKRCSFIDMPNILMIHLQKIVFDFDTLSNMKIADRYEFPTYLNMETYNIKKVVEKYNINDPELDKFKGMAGDNYEYRLVGVIIHQGVAQAGHYYSLICTDSKLREKSSQDWGDTSYYTWTEFNDKSIRSFDFRRNFEDECFGNSTDTTYGPSGDGWEQWQTSSGGSSKSAYVLIYEKRQYKDVRIGIELETVKTHGKTPEQIKKKCEEDRRAYLRSIYSSYKYTSPSLSQSESDATEDVKMESSGDDDSFMSSLECGNIAVPRELFPYLTVPHNVYIYLNDEEKDKSKYIPVEYNPDTKECVIKAKYKEVQKFIPYKIFKKVWDDNNGFMTERQLNNPDFFEFFQKTLKRENLIEQQNDQNKLSLVYDLCVKMIYSMLVYAFNNDSITEVAEVLKRVLHLSNDAVTKFAEFTIEHIDEIIRIFFKCPDNNVREAVSGILSTAVNRMFDSSQGHIESAEKIMNSLRGAIDTHASENWTKFEQFFNFFLQVIIGGDSQLEFAKKNMYETVFADFFLAERSPIRPPDQKRLSMGNGFSKPVYSPLIRTI